MQGLPKMNIKWCWHSKHELGVSKTDLVRRGVLNNAPAVLVNAKEMLRLLDSIGLELARSGNNLNQLARYANILNKRSMLSAVGR